MAENKYGVALKNKDDKSLFVSNGGVYNDTMVLVDSFETEGPAHVWSTFSDAKIKPCALTVINFPTHVLPSVSIHMDSGYTVYQPTYVASANSPPKALRINLFTPKSLSYVNWDAAHATYNYGITVTDSNNDIVVSPAIKYLLTKGIITATYTEIVNWILSIEEEVATEVWQVFINSGTPIGAVVYFSYTFKRQQHVLKRIDASDYNSYNYATGVALLNQPAFYLNMRHYAGTNKVNIGQRPYSIETKIYQDLSGGFGISFAAYTKRGNSNYDIPVGSNTNPFLAVVVDTEAYAI